MNHQITGTRPRVLGGCLQCAAGQPHDQHDTQLPAAARTSITTPTPAPRMPDPDIPGYGQTDHYPAI